MGGGPQSREQMLIIQSIPEPTSRLDEMRKQFPYIEVIYFETGPDKEVPVELYRNATILVTIHTVPLSPEDAPVLKHIHLFSAGFDHLLPKPILSNENITVTTSSGIHGIPISEWVLMSTLVLSHQYNPMYEWQKRKFWGKGSDIMFKGTDWYGKTVGILGYGSIGRQIARVFSSLGAHIHAYTSDARTTPASRADRGYFVPGTGDPQGTIPRSWYSGTSKTALHTFLRSGLDMVVVCVPLSSATTHLLSKEEFSILGSSCVVVNIARGKVLDQAALIDALNDGVLAGAALDVTDPEPLPEDNPLWTAKNVVITPHISALNREYYVRAFDLLVASLERSEQGKDWFNIVRPGKKTDK